jgi:hypothetical protein
MRWFSAEHSCSDGLTDAYLFLTSVHPMLLWCVGLVCHNSSIRGLHHFNPNTRRLHLPPVCRLLAVSGHLSRTRGSLASSVGHPCSPLALTAAHPREFLRAPPPCPRLVFGTPANSGHAPPRQVAGVHLAVRKGLLHHHSHSWTSPLCCGEHFPVHPLLVTISVQTRDESVNCSCGLSCVHE